MSKLEILINVKQSDDSLKGAPAEVTLMCELTEGYLLQVAQVIHNDQLDLYGF